MKLINLTLIRHSLLILLVVTSVLLGRSYYERYRCDTTRKLILIALDDVAKRVRSTADSLKTIEAMNDAAILSKTHAFARLVAADPSILKNVKELERVRDELDVDELHVSNDKGILIASIPTLYVGSDLTKTDQSRPFVAAIGNPKFELVQMPMVKGVKTGAIIDQMLFQYAGVARIDAPGVVQVGQNAERLEQAHRLADIKAIAKSVHFGRDGMVKIDRIASLIPAINEFYVERNAEGDKRVMIQRDCGAYRITISDDERCSWIASNGCRVFFEIFDLFLLIAYVFLGVVIHRKLLAQIKSVGGVFSNMVNRGFLYRLFTSQVTIAAFLIFIITLFAVWVIAMATTRRSAEDMLRTAAKDMRGAIEDCVDELLFYQGDAVCKLYKTPEAVTETACSEVMRRYDFDELNVVNHDGIVIMGAIAERGFDMGSNPHTAEFNCLLNGKKTFSQRFRGAIENPTLRRKYAGVAFPPPAKGYLQIGFAEERLKHGIDYWFADIARGWHIGDSGFSVIANEETGEIDSCGLSIVDENGVEREVMREGDTLSSIGFDVASAPNNPGSFFTATLYGRECLCLTEVRCFHRIITALPVDEMFWSVVQAVAATGVTLFLVLILVVVFMTRLSDLVVSLKEEKNRTLMQQKRELAAARVIQMSSLPMFNTKSECFNIYPEMHTAKEVGGDFYDYYFLPSGRFFFLVADVSGKGISAAMFMMKARAIIKHCMFEMPDIAAAVAEANSRLSDNNEAEMFVTCWCCACDLATGEIEYVNAGHNPPLIKRKDGSISWIRSRPSLVLAAMGGVKYRAEKFRIEPGDSLFLYTDGVTEAQDANGELYGEARLERVLAASGAKFVEEVFVDLTKFVNGAERSDDITMVAFDYIKPLSTTSA